MSARNYWGSRAAGGRVSRRSLIRGAGVGLAGLAGAALIGCGEDEAPSAGTPGPAATQTPGAGAAATAAPPQGPTGRVSVGLAGLGDQVWNPAGTSSGLAGIFAHAHFGEGLVIMGPELNNYVGGAADNWEIPSDDGLTWRFNLRQGVKFHNGETMTAEDVGFTIERFLDPVESPTAGAILQKELERFDVIDDKTVTLTWKLPRLVGVTLAGMYIMPKAAYSPTFGDKPIGIGPFKFVEAQRDQYAHLEAFEEHYRQVSAFKELRLQIIPEVTTRAAALATREIDVMLKPSGPTIPDIEGNPDTRLIEVASSSLNGLGFIDLGIEAEKERTIWADVRMREALAYAVDRDTIIDRLYFGKAVAADVPGAVRGLPGVPNLTPRNYDPEKARQLIAAAGHEGAEFPFYTYESGAQAGTIDTAQAVATYLQALGLKTQVQPIEQVAFFENLRGKTWAGQNAITAQVYGGRAAESWLGTVDPKGASPGFISAEYADAVTRLYTLAGEEAIVETEKLASTFYDELLYVPLISQNYVIGVGPKIKDWSPRMRLGFELGMEYIELA
jgi:peptide/nickel transport system substrate-binding protein